jgi:hypothetical protein
MHRRLDFAGRRFLCGRRAACVTWRFSYSANTPIFASSFGNVGVIGNTEAGPYPTYRHRETNFTPEA